MIISFSIRKTSEVRKKSCGDALVCVLEYSSQSRIFNVRNVLILCENKDQIAWAHHAMITFIFESFFDNRITQIQCSYGVFTPNLKRITKRKRKNNILAINMDKTTEVSVFILPYRLKRVFHWHKTLSQSFEFIAQSLHFDAESPTSQLLLTHRPEYKIM